MIASLRVGLRGLRSSDSTLLRQPQVFLRLGPTLVKTTRRLPEAPWSENFDFGRISYHEHLFWHIQVREHLWTAYYQVDWFIRLSNAFTRRSYWTGSAKTFSLGFTQYWAYHTMVQALVKARSSRCRNSWLGFAFGRGAWIDRKGGPSGRDTGKGSLQGCCSGNDGGTHCRNV